MLDIETKRRIDTARDILVGKVPDPKSQVEQITIALIYKFMDDMDREAEELGGERTFFSGEFEKFAWNKIFDPKIGGHELLSLYGEALLKLNINPNIPQLFRDIFKNAYLPYRDPETLKAFLKVIDEFTYDHSERLGDAFEYLLSVLGSQGSAGQFRTPRHIIDFMVEIIAPKKDETILDPACGTAGFLISSYKHILKHNSSNFDPNKDKTLIEAKVQSLSELTLNSKKYKGDKLTPDERARLADNITGYDISPDMIRLSLVNMYLHGLNDPDIFEYDTLTSEDNWNKYANVILANPPFMSPKGGIRPHNRFTVKSNRSEVLFVDYMAEHLTPNGRAAIIVPEGIIFQSGTAYKQLRKMLVDDYLVGVISLPAGVFNPYSGVKTSIIWLDKALAKKTNNILFVKITADGFDLGAQRRPIKENSLPESLKQISTYKQALQKGNEMNLEAVPNFSLVDKSKIAANGDYNLSGERYKFIQKVSSQFEQIPIGEFCRVINGRAYKQEELLDKGKYPVLRVGNFFSNRDWYYSDLELEENKYCEKGDLLYAWSASFGPKIWDGEKSIYHYHIWKMIPDEARINKQYLFHVLNFDTEAIKSEGGRGIAMIHITKAGIEQRQIPLPPLSVQQEIVSGIEGYQKIIDGARMVVENYKPQIKIDPEWEMVELGDFAKVISGFGFDSKDFSSSNPIKCIKITHVGVREFVEDLESNLPFEYFSKFQDFTVNKGDIVISLTRSIISTGFKVAIVSDLFDGALVNQRVAAIKEIEGRSKSKFIYYYLCTPYVYNYVLDKSRSLMQPNLSITDLKKLLIPKPDCKIQLQIISEIEKEENIIHLNKELIKIYEQKIKDRIAEVWGEGKEKDKRQKAKVKTYNEGGGEALMAAEG